MAEQVRIYGGFVGEIAIRDIERSATMILQIPFVNVQICRRRCRARAHTVLFFLAREVYVSLFSLSVLIRRSGNKLVAKGLG